MRRSPIKSRRTKPRRIKQQCVMQRCKHSTDRGLLVCLSHAKHLADAEFARRVRERGVCADQHVRPHVCSGGFQCAHGWSRADLGTRWDLRNAFCLCAAAHQYYTLRPTQWYEWMRRVQGEELFEQIRLAALKMVKVDYALLLRELALERYASAE